MYQASCEKVLPTRAARRWGITMIEILITVAIAAILMGVSIVNLYGFRNRTDLSNTTRTIGAALREAQSRAIAQASSSAWGVHFENSTTTRPFYALFISTTYSATSTVTRAPLPLTVAYVTSSLALGAARDVTFAQLTGAPSASTSIVIAITGNGSASATIAVASSGAITY